MFTGLVETTATVISLTELGEQARLTLDLPFASELKLGDSVAINGCCLTVAHIEGSHTHFDILKQTLTLTSLGSLQKKSLVNAERALALGDRLGGHFVQGHIDTTGTIHTYTPQGQDHRLQVTLPKSIHALCIDKGSLTIDGISLTIAELTPDTATFWITPHTHQHTHLQNAQPSQTVNLEADLLAKYIQKLITPQKENEI